MTDTAAVLRQPLAIVFERLGVCREPRGKNSVARGRRNERVAAKRSVAELMRPDAASREKFYQSGSQNRYLCPNDVRAMEKMNPIDEPWAEEFMMPVNYTMATTPINPNTQDGAGNGAKPAVPSKQIKQSVDDVAFRRLFVDCFERIVSGGNRDLAAFKMVFEPVFLSLRDDIAREANVEFSCLASPVVESDRFVGEYLASMQKRCAKWERAEESAVMAEVGRFRRAIRVSVFREVAAAKAKEPLVMS